MGTVTTRPGEVFIHSSGNAAHLVWNHLSPIKTLILNTSHCCANSYPPLTHVLFSPILTFLFFLMPLQSLSPICPFILAWRIKRPRPECVLTEGPLTGSQAILRGAEPPSRSPSKRQRHSKSTLEAGRHNLLPSQRREATKLGSQLYHVESHRSTEIGC